MFIHSFQASDELMELLELFETVEKDGVRWEEIKGKDCTVYIEKRPPYCDRGRIVAKVEVHNPVDFTVDWADGFPRYYFNETFGKIEILTWLKVREQI